MGSVLTFDTRSLHCLYRISELNSPSLNAAPNFHLCCTAVSVRLIFPRSFVVMLYARHKVDLGKVNRGDCATNFLVHPASNEHEI
jgi:hypothetical protein